jgi:hypothetical protein
VLSAEHTQVGEFTETEVPGLVMPQGYNGSIATWYAALRDMAGPGASTQLPTGPHPTTGESL